MSRHRKKMTYHDDDDDEDEDQDYYGKSFDDEVPMSPSASQFMSRRNRLSSSNYGSKLGEFIPEGDKEDEDEDFSQPQNNAVDDDDHMFEMELEEAKTASLASLPTPSKPPISTGPPPGLSFGAPPGLTPSQSKPVVLSIPTPASTSGEKKAQIPSLVKLQVSETPRSNSKSPSRAKATASPGPGGSKNTPTTALAGTSTMTSNSSSHRLNQLAAISSVPSTPKRGRKRDEKDKQLINLVVVGHVDAGKSTLMGHLLCQLGCVDQRTMHKYKQESARSGKASFAFAWVLDETEEERSRGVTMDIAKTSFETNSKRVLLLDAPGHKDFIPNMITGASQADAAILVVNATTGEFETGFENGGQTREHSMLLRSLGVSQLVVAVNKLDTVDWSEARFREVEAVMKTFLTKQAGFPKIRFVPVSGLGGDNLTEKLPATHALSSWYKGETLVEMIDSFHAPPRAAEGPLRIVINDVLKATTTQLSLIGKVESGEVENGDKIFIMPNAEAAVVKACTNDDGGSVDNCTAGSQVLLTLNGTFEPDAIHKGHVIVRGGPDTLIPGRRFRARLVVFDVLVPLMKGTKAELYCHSLCEPVTIVHLKASINKATGDVLKERPRCLSKQMSGLVELETDFDVAIEPYTVCKALGRVTLRSGGQTIAAGIIEERLDNQNVVKGK